jgi:hypothetical protein
VVQQYPYQIICRKIPRQVKTGTLMIDLYTAAIVLKLKYHPAKNARIYGNRICIYQLESIAGFIKKTAERFNMPICKK